MMEPVQDFLRGLPEMRGLRGLRGQLARNAPLKDLVWFRTGGAADILYRPADIKDLCAFLAACPANLPVCAIGVGSNLLVRDGGVEGVVIRLPSAFGKIEQTDETHLRVGAAALDATVARAAADAGIAGLEFLRTIPGTIGGALVMNAGCYGREIRDIFVEARAVNARGHLVTLDAGAMGFSYRHTKAPDTLIFVDALIQGTRDAPGAIRARMEKLVAEREATQPTRTKTGGSTFKNPPGGTAAHLGKGAQSAPGGTADHLGKGAQSAPGGKAWKLIDQAGCRGLRVGGAQVSEKHCNFLINTGEASAADIEALGEELRARVRQHAGIDLEWEIRRVGRTR